MVFIYIPISRAESDLFSASLSWDLISLEAPLTSPPSFWVLASLLWPLPTLTLPVDSGPGLDELGALESGAWLLP
jgi:hypothetical protein